MTDTALPDPARVPFEATPIEIPATPDEPVRAAERIVALDLIRGIAVLGILFANITAFGHPDAAYFWPKALPGGATWADKAVWYLQLVLVDHKFRGLFSILFGAGVYLFMEKAWARGSTRWLQARRLAWLMLFGAIHYFFIWRGDILGTYAATGIMMLPLLKWSAARQMKVGIGLYLFGALFMLVALGSMALAATNPDIAARLPGDMQDQITGGEAKMLEDVGKSLEMFRTSGFLEMAQHRIANQAGQFIGGVLFFPFMETLGLALIGAALYRRGFFAPPADPANLRRRGWTWLIAGMAYTALVSLWPLLTDFPLFTTMFVFNELARLGQVPMGLGLAAIIVAGGQPMVDSALGSRLAAAGRMAFSNYLGTSILLLFVFPGWSLGLFGRFHRPELFLMVLAVWTMMLLWSKAWLARFRYGPLEWLWRCLTYWKLFPLRR